MVVLEVKRANVLEKIIGLIGQDRPKSLFLKTRFGIHTFGVKFPIEILVLDNNCCVVKLVKNVKPNSIIVWNPVFDTILELPIGTIEKKRIRLGDRIRLRVV